MNIWLSTGFNITVKMPGTQTMVLIILPGKNRHGSCLIQYCHGYSLSGNFFYLRQEHQQTRFCDKMGTAKQVKTNKIYENLIYIYCHYFGLNLLKVLVNL